MKLFILFFALVVNINFSAQTAVKPTESVSVFRLRKNAERRNSRSVSNFQNKIIHGTNSPDDISRDFVQKLVKIGYKQATISPEKIRAVTELLSSYKFGISTTATACLPVYRDILIYKTNGKLTKVIKICTSCYQNQVILPEKTTELLISWEDYERLEKIFEPKNYERKAH